MKSKVTKIIAAVAGVADNLLTGGKLASVISAITGDSTMSDTEKEQALKELEMILADTQNARDNETARDTSANTSWLSKNVHELIAIALVCAFIGTVYIVRIPQSIELASSVTLVLGYLFGKTKPEK